MRRQEAPAPVSWERDLPGSSNTAILLACIEDNENGAYSGPGLNKVDSRLVFHSNRLPVVLAANHFLEGGMDQMISRN